MKRRRLGLTVVAMLGLGLGLAGCPEPTKKKPVQPDSSAGGDGGTGGGFGGSGGGSGGSGGGSGGSGGSGGRDAGSGGSGGSGGRDGGTAGTGGRDGGGTTADSGARDGGGGATGTVSFRTNVAPILMKCVGCHPPATAAMGYMWFQQNAATGRACAGRKRLDVVVSKLDPAATAACGGKMPPAAAPMKPTAAEIETVKTWVMEGGMNN